MDLRQDHRPAWRTPPVLALAVAACCGDPHPCCDTAQDIVTAPPLCGIVVCSSLETRVTAA